MVTVLDELELTGLVTTIAGLTAVGAAAILAETGDPARFALPGHWTDTPGCARGITPRVASREGRRFGVHRVYDFGAFRLRCSALYFCRYCRCYRSFCC